MHYFDSQNQDQKYYVQGIYGMFNEIKKENLVSNLRNPNVTLKAPPINVVNACLKCT